MAKMGYRYDKLSALFWLPVITSGFLSTPASGQVVMGRVAFPGENRATATHLTAAVKLVAEKQWSQAIDEFLRIQEESGDDLVPVDSSHLISARRLCHKGLADLPPEALRLYRDRIESQAKKWFEQGKAERDPRLFQRLVDEAFCSRYTDRALDLLGDLSFERGRFEEAQFWWNMLALPASQRVPHSSDQTRFELIYPDPQVDLARVRAKQLLARLFVGDRLGWSEDLKVFRKLHGNPRGTLAGESGSYSDILNSLFNRSVLIKAVAEKHNRNDSWLTFAGSPSRNFIAPHTPRRLALESPPWPLRLDGQPIGGERPLGKERTGKSSNPQFQPTCYPVISGNLVFISNSRSITAYDVLTAQQVGYFDLNSVIKSNGDERQSRTGEREFTVTVSEGRLYAVLGNGQVELGPNNLLRGSSILVCLDLPPEPNGQFHLRWSRIAGGLESPQKETSAIWKGTPVFRDNRIFIAETRLEKNHGITSLKSYDAESGQIRWQREVSLPPVSSNPGVLEKSHLLTLTGQCAVYCSDAGVIVAVDASTGHRVWAFRYPSRSLRTDNGEPWPRGLCPVVYQSGRVFAAPADYAGVLSLNALTGEKIWERKDIEVVHLLGVAKGRLIVTTARLDTPRTQSPAGIRALDANSGANIRQWIQPEDGSSLPSFGRGLIAGDRVIWPVLRTSDNGPETICLNLEDGSQPEIDADPLWHVHAGNFALGKGFLAAADETFLYVYVSTSHDQVSGVRGQESRVRESSTHAK